MQDLAGVIAEEDVNDISQELEYSYKQAVDRLYAQKIINRNAAKNPMGSSSKSGPGTSSRPSVKLGNVDNDPHNKQLKKRPPPGKKRGGPPNKER